MAAFVDQAQLHARAGDGGAGAVSWRREAHVDRGGPDGGDGGHGGDVWLVASVNQSSLLGFRDHPFRRATDGGHGSGQKKHGARGKDVVVPVPVGTVVRDAGGAVMCDLAQDGDRFLRHIERARVVVVLLDLDPLAVHAPAEQLRILLGELGSYQPELLERPRLVVGSKQDLSPAPGTPAPGPPAPGTAAEEPCDLVLSAATGAGVQVLVEQLAAVVHEARAAAVVAATSAVVTHRPAPEGVTVQRVSPGTWRVEGRVAERAVAFSDLTDDGALSEAVRRLRRLGVDRALARAGVRDGDEVTVGTMTFTWGEP